MLAVSTPSTRIIPLSRRNDHENQQLDQLDIRLLLWLWFFVCFLLYPYRILVKILQKKNMQIDRALASPPLHQWPASLPPRESRPSNGAVSCPHRRDPCEGQWTAWAARREATCNLVRPSRPRARGSLFQPQIMAYFVWAWKVNLPVFGCVWSIFSFLVFIFIIFSNEVEKMLKKPPS